MGSCAAYALRGLGLLPKFSTPVEKAVEIDDFLGGMLPGGPIPRASIVAKGRQTRCEAALRAVVAPVLHESWKP